VLELLYQEVDEAFVRGNANTVGDGIAGHSESKNRVCDVKSFSQSMLVESIVPTILPVGATILQSFDNCPLFGATMGLAPEVPPWNQDAGSKLQCEEEKEDGPNNEGDA
jgi:hypothetical protein